LDDDIRRCAGDDVAELLLAVLCAVDELDPDRLYPGVELLDRRLAEFGRGVADEVLPELTGVLRGVRGRSQVDQILLEPQRGEFAGPGRLSREDDPVAALTQHVTDTDAVVRRSVGTLGHEQHRQLRHRVSRPLTKFILKPDSTSQRYVSQGV